MKTIKVIYWTTTAIVALMMIYSAFLYLTEEGMKAAFEHLGFSDYFRVQLAIAKLIGAGLLLAPVARRLKEWAYAGFAFTFISAFIAHVAAGDPIDNRVGPIIFLGLLVASYLTYHKWQEAEHRTPHSS